MPASENKSSVPANASLRRVVGVPGAVMMGLGSILGTGIFVSIGIAAGIAGSSVVWAIVLAAVVATFNGLSSAQLAANHPVSGGTYEYGYRYLTPTLGFVAGWMFLCAKSASAATAALGFAGYLVAMFYPTWLVSLTGLAIVAVLVLTGLVAGGISRSNRANILIVCVTLVALAGFVVSGLVSAGGTELLANLWAGPDKPSEFLHATALMFVAYTGYGRIATLGEEVRDPRRSIPRAIVITLGATSLLYAVVTFVAVGRVGADGLALATERGAAPLASAASSFSPPLVGTLVAVGAITAMLGVLLNLILGLSRVVLAMARRRDLPTLLAHIDRAQASPRRAVIFVGVIVAALAGIGSVKTTWSLSAFTVLVYYALTNLAALRLSASERLYPRWVSVCGLVACLGLAFWVEPEVWAVGLGIIAVGVGGRAIVEVTRTSAGSPS